MTMFSAKFGQTLAIASTMMCCGCFIPTAGVVSPPIDGNVQDAETHRPIEDAEVTIHAGFSPSYDGPTTIVHSDASGHFMVPEKMGRVWMPPLPYDRMMPGAKISVSASGYGSQDVKWGFDVQPSIIYLQHIEN